MIIIKQKRIFIFVSVFAASLLFVQSAAAAPKHDTKPGWGKGDVKAVHVGPPGQSDRIDGRLDDVYKRISDDFKRIQDRLANNPNVPSDTKNQVNDTLSNILKSLQDLFNSFK